MDPFERRLRAASRAGWWTLLVGVGVVLLQWLVYLAVTSRRPSWVLALWGSTMSWEDIQSVWLYAILAMRMLLFALALSVVWATIWAAALRKRAPAARTVEPPPRAEHAIPAT